MFKAAFRYQFLRFAAVGVVSNAFLYICYLALTFYVGVEHKVAMSLVYVTGVLITFIVNRSWSFNHRGVTHMAFVRYVLAYVVGYFLNLALLWLAVDRLGLPHALVQAAAIFLVAVCMFLLHKYWVFAPKLKGAES